MRAGTMKLFGVQNSFASKLFGLTGSHYTITANQFPNHTSVRGNSFQRGEIIHDNIHISEIRIEFDLYYKILNCTGVSD